MTIYFFYSQVQARLKIVATSASAGDAQEVFKITFNALRNGDYSVGVDTESYQSILEYALSNIDFLFFLGIYMLSGNLNLNNKKTVG